MVGVAGVWSGAGHSDFEVPLWSASATGGPQMALRVVCSRAGVLGAPDGGVSFLEGVTLHKDGCHPLRPGDQRRVRLGLVLNCFSKGNVHVVREIRMAGGRSSFPSAGLRRFPFLTHSSRAGLCADRRELSTLVPVSTHAACLWTSGGSLPTLLQGTGCRRSVCSFSWCLNI